MAFTCIPLSQAKAFKKALKDKDIKIADLLNMDTEARTTVFEQFAGKQAKSMNTLFEEKLVLKNKVQGLKNFIAKVAQEGRYSPEKKAELEAMVSEFRQRQQERIFSPQEEQAFLNDLADTTIGTHITRAQAKNIFDLTAKVDEIKKGLSDTEHSPEYGAAKVVLDKYTEALAEGDTSVKALIRETMSQFKDTAQENRPKAVGQLLLKTLKTISDNSIAFVASLDNSFLGRQGLKTLMTHPSVWWPAAKASFADIAKTFGGQNTKDALLADIYGNPNYRNGAYEKAKILSGKEEQYPTSLPERIPYLGRAFKASQAAFEGSALRMRTGLYDLLSEKMKGNGVDMEDKYNIQSLGRVINSLTAKGQFGKVGESPLVRLVLWAPKMLKANWDVLTAHTGQDIAPFARKEAALNLAKIVATTAAIMTLANAIKPGSAETDPRSSNFGKIKVGNTTFDYTGGAGSLLVLAARLISNSSKSTGTGLVKPFGTGFGQQTRTDAVINFLEGKTTPALGALIALGKGTTPTGQKATPVTVATNAVAPIALTNTIQLKDDHSVSAVAGVLLDALGINANTYGATDTDWTQNIGVELQQFKAEVGDQKFAEANKAYNQQVAAWLKAMQQTPAYESLSDADKQKAITNKKGYIKAAILKQYGFTYKKATPTKLPTL